jgi:hypothetical protein
LRKRGDLAASTTKKAIVRRFDREPLTGYVNSVSFLQPGGVELLTVEGNVTTVPYREMKSIAFVRDFSSNDHTDRLVFKNRPKTEGLWVILQFRDGDALEGIMPNNLLQVEPYGFTVIPPDPGSNQQRVFAPREALRAVEVLGVVGSPLHRRKIKPTAKEQIGLFDEP